MCGRVYNLGGVKEIVAWLDWLGRLEVDDALPDAPRYNIAPTEPILTLTRTEGRCTLGAARWGLIPPWWREPKPPGHTFNARAEGLATAPTFRGSLGRGRAIILVSGFYEWQKVGQAKRPLAIHHPTSPILGLAALTATWTSPAGDPIPTATIITAAPTAAMEAVHDRMPAVLPDSAWTTWLDADVPTALALLDRRAEVPLAVEEVGAAVGNARDKSGTWFPRGTTTA